MLTLRAVMLLVLALACSPRAFAQGSWAVAATSNDARSFHSAVRLGDGRVLVVGGRGTNPWASLLSAELYNPGTNQWTLTGSVAQDRVGAPLLLLPNGNAIVIGATAQPEAEIYSVLGGTWGSAGTVPFVREAPRAAMLSNGQIVVAGGYASTMTPPSSSWLYTPLTNTWAVSGQMIFDRVGHTATALNNDSVIFVGGGNPWTLATHDFTDKWTAGSYSDGGPLANARASHAAVKLASGDVLVVGGRAYQSGVPVNTAELYTPGGWTSVTAPALRYRQYHTLTLLNDGRVLLVGGTNTSDVNSGQTEIYNPATNSWSFGATMTYPRMGHTATLLADGRVLIEGGGVFTHLPAEIYTP